MLSGLLLLHKLGRQLVAVMKEVKQVGVILIVGHFTVFENWLCCNSYMLHNNNVIP